MGRVILVGRLNVSCSTDNTGSCYGSNGSTDSFCGGNIGVGWSIRHECILVALKSSPGKLVDHKTLEAICNRIDVINPSRPASHIWNRKREARVDDDS